MKFSCDRCQTRYSIGDDKVKGKVLKIRCKTCGNIVVVREQLPTVQGEASGYATPQMAAGGTGSINVSPSSQTGSRPAVPTPAGMAPAASSFSSKAGAEIDWYVAIKGKQHGPAKRDDVARLFRDGRITDRTYVWHDQLPSWIRLKDLPEFAAVVAEGPAPKRPPPPPMEEGAEIVNFEAARAQRHGPSMQTGSNQASPPGPVFNDPFASLPTGPGGGPEAPRESTRVFIMQAGLHNRASKHKLYASIGVAVTLGIIAIGVIDYQLDILGLKRVVDAVAVSTGIKQQDPDPVEGGWEEEEGDIALKCQFAPDAADCIKKAKARIAAGGGRKRGNKPVGIGGTGVSDADLKDAFGTPTPGTDPGPTTTTKMGSDGFMGVGGGGLAMDTSGLGKRTGPTAPQVKIDLPSTEGTTIDAANAAKVVRDGQGGIQVCVDNAMKNNDDIPQKIRMTLSIGLKGSVERAVINNAVVQASGLGTCLTGAARKWKFAPPSEPADLEIPLVLR